MEQVVCSLGSNLGVRDQNIAAAISALKSYDIFHIKTAPLYETAPVGLTDQPSFLNTAIIFRSAIAAADLLEIMLGIERGLGRSRRVRWGPRTIDIDIIFYGSERIVQERLTIPHPRFAMRKFVLVPLSDLIPGFVPPGFSQPVAGLLQACGDESDVRLYRAETD